jgi:hypothetical protein
MDTHIAQMGNKHKRKKKMKIRQTLQRNASEGKLIHTKKGVLAMNDSKIPRNALNMKLKGKHPRGRQ